METMSMEEKRYTIGQASGMLGTSSSTVRYYEAKGLLPNLGRTEGSIRTFTDGDLDRMRPI